MRPHFRYDEIPPDHEDGSSSWVHAALILTGRLGEVKPILLLPVWVALTLLASLTWPDRRPWAALSLISMIVADWVMLAGLPRTRRSWGPVTPPLLGLAVVHAVLTGAGGWIMSGRVGLSVVTLINALLTAVAIYATWVEPFRIQLTRQNLQVEGWPDDKPITFLHISDIHFEQLSRREHKLLDLIKEHQPDLLLLTGDYLNLSSVYDPEAQQGVRRLLSQFRAPLGIYAVTGSPVVDVETVIPEIFEGLPIRWLQDDIETLHLGEHSLQLIGVRTTYQEERDIAALASLIDGSAAGETRILLYHTPDLAPAAAKMGIALYLCGHTHGGQIRLPIYGAIATSSRWGKRYEQGRYEEGTTTLYVSRGLGLEGLGAPRARFLAPPEIVLWTITGPPQL
jgi:predicted MPP superfamily phosphohydrolase